MWPIIRFIVIYNYKLFFCECFMILPLFLENNLELWCHFCYGKCVYIKFSTRADILSCKMIMENDINIVELILS